jgi:hypothetical protein
MFIREDNADVRVSIDGKPYFGSWRTYQGADKTANTSKTRPGAMGDEVDVGGPPTRNDCTCTIQWNENVLGKYKELDNKVGWADVTITVTWLNRKTKAPFDGASFTKTGTLKGCSDPNFDSNGNAVGELTIVVGMDEKQA